MLSYLTDLKTIRKHETIITERYNELEDAEKAVLGKKRWAISKAIQSAELEAQTEYQKEHRFGYCPRCFILKNGQGFCDICGC